ncbi:glycine betaine ABC transporter substrate-binding protein [Paenibacillaceae bacterium]|nr:glycine betaine ABC transporter substrate-binding protein [Paenibacillaceae bacterium]
MLKKFNLFVVAIVAVVLLAACGAKENTGSNTNPDTSGTGGNNEKKEIKLAYVAWDSEIASTYVVKEVLEQKLGYKVDMLQVDAGPMFAGVADGSADAMVAAWLPATHESYIEQYGDRLVDLGPNLNGTKLGLAVPSYMDITSIEDLANGDVGAEVDHKIIGIEPGAGLMMATEKMVEEYGLDKWTVLESSSAAMAQELQKAYKAEQPIIVTGWTPHWMFAAMDLKYLDDPKGVYGADEQIHTMTRQGLEEDKADAFRVLDNFSWTPDDMAEVMVEIMEGSSPEDAAKAWVDSNEDKVNAWIGS